MSDDDRKVILASLKMLVALMPQQRREQAMLEAATILKLVQAHAQTRR